ncbi:YjbQ family protein [archaeon]|jgi:secondary thiamine-phosphate synthase enzyme|nr:YjbQ family protein [archaeon]
MKYFLEEVNLETDNLNYFYDITRDVRENVLKSDIEKGHVSIHPLHTTGGIYLNELEERLLQDFEKYIDKEVPRGKGLYLHDDFEKRNCLSEEPLNGHSHLKVNFYSNPSLSLVLYRGELMLGEYQKIFFAEFDSPCSRKNKRIRKYLVSVIGE